ncbi:ammonia-forming cytochrome c nitrite reductase subunit c552 [Dethiobacter alkaliphilus]|uniref:nitrite reductase (cytochrome; ammonia-forming) n=1 Tax=Dethiobacter alkaliphilus AHT 1 TaxID=555088 RepID=C0GJ80_DETAL|nr:ammonia-forming cytochrome c nitrite reductase subunit c552 [Dethiobacter alkaliphilus]EEG76565.1 hypothetical protein DealDRAFT_2539 [Dethiobacter alkaliphilus AHT 1]
MKKHWLLVVILAFALSVAVIGCGENGNNNDNNNGDVNGNGNGAAVEGLLEATNAITAEWRESGKQFAMAGVADRPGAVCASCHDGFGFANKNGINFADQWNPGGADEDMDMFPEHITGLTCEACHAGAGLDYMESGTVELPYGTVDNAGTGAACMFCHSGRRDTPAAFAEYEAGEATGFTYPHYGPAAVFTGMGGMEYPDMDYASTGAHANLADSCVACHMPETADGYKAHNFTMDLAYIDQTCGSCHSGLEDYNYNGYLDEIQGMMDTLQEAIFEATGATGLSSARGQLVFETDGEPLGVEDVDLAAFVAAYTWYEINYEGSMGIHNPAYAKSLIENSYYRLTGEEM